MKIQLLEEFVVLAETLNFTKASQKLCLTQPVLSRHIKELEDFFGDELFIRDTHSVRLSGTGQLLHLEANKVINQYKTSITNVKNFTGKSKQNLSMVYLGDAFGLFLGREISKFKENNPNIHVNYRDCELDEAINFIKTNSYDLGFVIRPKFIQPYEGFDVHIFAKEPLYAIVNKEHTLAKKDKTSLKSLAKYPIIREDIREFSEVEQFSTDFFKTKDIQFQLYKEYPNIKTCIFNLEMNKDAILLIPKHRVDILGRNLKGVEIEDEDCFYTLEITWNKQNCNPSLKRFVKEFTQNYPAI